jgi:hypothetical protein
MEDCAKCSESMCSLEELKSEFEKHQKKHDLPSFTDLNRVFDIEELDIDSEFFLRKVRRLISERVAGYLRFAEMILNPSNAPMFFFSAIKKLTNEDKEKLTKIHETLGKFEIEIIELDIEYNEDKEIEFIKRAYKLLTKDIKEDFLSVIHKLGNGKGKKSNDDSDSYFG